MPGKRVYSLSNWIFANTDNLCFFRCDVILAGVRHTDQKITDQLKSSDIWSGNVLYEGLFSF